MQFVLLILSQFVARLLSMMLRGLVFALPIGVLIGMVALFINSWAPLPFTHGELGLSGPVGILVSTVMGFLVGLNVLRSKAAPLEEQTLKSARRAEKAKVERDLATDQAAALQAKIATLEVALQKALDSKRGSMP
jgi:hypothetical protein